MEACIAIVSYKWAGWILANNTFTDPMGLGIINWTSARETTRYAV
jgi:hypothetical protein